MGFRRFKARRGRPRTVYSDSGTNILVVLTIYSKTLTINILKDNLLFPESNEKLIPPTTTWWGGWWESIVQMVKKLAASCSWQRFTGL